MAGWGGRRSLMPWVVLETLRAGHSEPGFPPSLDDVGRNWNLMDEPLGAWSSMLTVAAWAMDVMTRGALSAQRPCNPGLSS
jgi:hypothetical protein